VRKRAADLHLLLIILVARLVIAPSDTTHSACRWAFERREREEEEQGNISPSLRSFLPTSDSFSHQW